MPDRKSLVRAASIASLAVLSFFAGQHYSRRVPSDSSSQATKRITRYACPMHPQYVSDHPGDAPCCGMRLEPVSENGSTTSANGASSVPGLVHVPAEKQQLIGVATDVVEDRVVHGSLRLAGRVVPDERRLYPVITKVEGVVRQIHPPTTGSRVERGQPLAAVYSKDLLIAQQGYIYALNAVDKVQSDEGKGPALEQLKLTAAESLNVLQNLEFSDKQTKELAKSRQPMLLVDLVSPADGYIVSRNAFLNQRFGLSTELFRVADLSHVWVMADVFERDRDFVKPGAPATIGYRGKSFHARIADVSPQFDPSSRTLKVRLEIDNPGHLLRPDMLVDVELKVMLPRAVAVPAEAVTDSGVRRVVFVDRGNGYFEPRSVETGWRLGDRVQITKGLDAGERIVVSGNFLIDSESRMKMAAVSSTPTMLAAAAAGTEKDVVCNMDVDPRDPKVLKAQHGGKTYYFCSEHCKRTFEKNPEKYVPKQKGAEKPRRSAQADGAARKAA